jgi:pyrimidine deaminase RibD-like protein/NTP pyrophosphatase (non-canonical NTP hydrolase)
MSDTEMRFMKETIEESKKSIDEDGRNHPKVGAIIVDNGEIIARAHRGEISGSHAEYIALRKMEDVSLENATVYTTLEPCTSRNHPKISCAERLVRRKVGHVVIGMLDPDPTISGKGVRFLRRSGMKVTFFTDELMREVEKINKKFDSQFEPIKLAAEKQTIDSFQRYLNDIYGGVNAKLSIEYIYGYLHRTVDFLLVNMSKGRAYELEGQIKPIDFIRPISWLFALATKLGCDMQTAFFTKYPNTCPYCLEDTCVCHLTGKRPRPRLSLATRKKKSISPYQIREELRLKYNSIKAHHIFGFNFAMQVIASVYPLNKVIWSKAGSSYHTARMLEELGEVHEAISLFVKGKVDPESRLFSEELADVLGWLLSAWDIVFPTLSLDTEILNYYVNSCPLCNRKPCICLQYEGRSMNLIQLETVSNVKEYLIKLQTMNDNPVIAEMITSVSEAEKLQSDPQIRLCFSEVAYHLDALEKSIKTSDDLYKEMLSIIHNMLRIINPIIDKDSSSYFYNTRIFTPEE